MHVHVVRDGLDHRDLTCALRGDALLHQGAGVNEQSRADAFFEPMVAQVPHLAAQFDEPVGHVFGDAGFMLDDGRFDLRGRIREFDCQEPLFGALFEFFEYALVAGVVGHDEHEVIDRFDHLPAFFDGQEPAVVAERVHDYRGVFSGFDDFIQVDDGPVFHPEGQGAVHPHGFFAFEEIPAHQVRRGEILMAGHRNQRALQPVCQVLHEPGLAAARRAFQHHRQLLLRRNIDEPDFAVDLFVKRLFGDPVLFDVDFVSLHASPASFLPDAPILRAFLARRAKGPDDLVAFKDAADFFMVGPVEPAFDRGVGEVLPKPAVADRQVLPRHIRIDR